MKLAIVRHGLSAKTWSRVVDGDNDPDLSPTGIKEVKKIAPYFDEGQFDLVYASPLNRAFKTAQILSKGKKQIHLDSRLVELRMETWKSKKQEQKAYRYAFDSLKCVQANYINYANHAESFVALQNRCRSFLKDLLKNHSHQTILVVSHGITIRALLAVILKLDMEQIMNVNNVAFTEVFFDPAKNYAPRLMSFNRKYPLFYGHVN